MGVIKIFLADDHTIVRDGIKHIISAVPEYEVIGEACNGKEAIDRIEQLQPDIVVMDISMPVINGIEVSRQVKRYWPKIKIIILSRHDNDEYIEQVMKYGVDGYVVKDCAGSELVKAIEDVNKNNVYMCACVMKKIVNQMSNTNYELKKDNLFDVLSEREIQVLKLISEGISGSKIAKILRISENTVKVHRTNIMKKLGLHKTAELVRYAVKKGLVDS